MKLFHVNLFSASFRHLEPLCAALLALAHILFSAMLLPLRFDGLSHETCYFFSSKNVSSCAKHTRSCLKLTSPKVFSASKCDERNWIFSKLFANILGFVWKFCVIFVGIF